jgi:predicted membrane-bound spermidine synthase
LTAIEIARNETTESGRSPAPRRRRVFSGIAVVSLGVLMLQLVFTRFFSATMYYHFAFLAISLALFGSGAGGVLVYVLAPRLREGATEFWLGALSLMFSGATVLALLVVLGSPLSPTDDGATTFLRLSRIYLAAALPFLCAGATVALAVSRYASEMSRLYLFDLAGAGLGCLLLIPTLDVLGAVNTVLLVAVLASIAAVVFTASGPGSLRAWSRSAAVATAALLVGNGIWGTLDIRSAKGLLESGNVIFSRWNSFSRVTVWGSLAAEAVHIMIDADAATLISRDAGNPSSHPELADAVESLAYHLRPGGKALIIGPGGGNDVVMARLFGAREITAVEVNPIIARDVMSSEPFRTYSGWLYDQPGVRLVVDEGRSFIRSSRERYDVIQGTMVDTWAATAAGAFALTENNLYTVEAFRDYLGHLEDDGILSMTRWYLEPPDQLVRLVSLARTALDEQGARAPAAHVVLVRGATEPGSTRAPSTFLLKKSPFTAWEIASIEKIAARSGFDVLYAPGRAPHSLFAQILQASDPQQVWQQLDSNVEPTRDDNPFFFNTLRLRNLGRALASAGEFRKTNLGTFVLMALLVIATALAALMILGPLMLVRGRLEGTPVRRKVSWLLFFACLGFGFIVIEVAMVQKSILFLGHPVYALAVVLFALLVSSGLGSSLSGRFAKSRLRLWLVVMLAAVAAIVILYVLALSTVFYTFVHLPHAHRIAIATAVLAPLGIVMGMPMPTAIRILARELPELIPWGWGVNGAASVTGSIASLAIALLAGFNQALLAGAFLYLVAVVLVRSGGRAV